MWVNSRSLLHFFAGAYLKDEQYSIMIDETCSIVSTICWFGGTLALFIILRRGLQRAHVGSVGRETENLKHYFDQLSLIPKISLFISFGFAVFSCIDQKLWIICFLCGLSGNMHSGVCCFVFDFLCVLNVFFLQYIVIFVLFCGKCFSVTLMFYSYFQSNIPAYPTKQNKKQTLQ